MPRRFFYDCEFLDDGITIALISIGIVAADGRELYLVNADAPWQRIADHEWLMGNVVPHLPGAKSRRVSVPKMWLIDFDDPRVQPKTVIAERVRQFLTGPDENGRFRGEEPVELWAWYGAYDHVALAQLWGPMVALPAGVPMFTHDLQQEVERLGNPALPPQPSGAVHDALEDARTLRRRWDWLREYAAAAQLRADGLRATGRDPG